MPRPACADQAALSFPALLYTLFPISFTKPGFNVFINNITRRTFKGKYLAPNAYPTLQSNKY
jgi:hypothetical protein